MLLQLCFQYLPSIPKQFRLFQAVRQMQEGFRTSVFQSKGKGVCKLQSHIPVHSHISPDISRIHIPQHPVFPEILKLVLPVIVADHADRGMICHQQQGRIPIFVVRRNEFSRETGFRLSGRIYPFSFKFPFSGNIQLS